MAIDPDLVRIDLLRCKRQLYLMYPEGSKERSDFLATSKLSEINYLSNLVPKEVSALVFQEYRRTIKFEILDIVVYFAIGVAISSSLYFCHLFLPKNLWLHFWSVPFCLSIFESLRHIWYIVNQWKKMKPFRLEYKELQVRINKLRGELKDIK